MTSIENLLAELEERTIVQRVSASHDEARMGYPLQSNTVGSFDEFDRIVGDYYNYHFTRCVSHGGYLSSSEACGRAKELLERGSGRGKVDIVTVCNDAHDGTNGGLRVILDNIAEGIKAESLERYIRDVFDRHVTPNSWEHKLEIIRQFINHCGVHLSSSIQRDQPERYAQNYEELIRTYVNALQETSSIFRRL